MARAQIVEKLLSQVGHGVDVENEKVGALIDDEPLGIFQVTGKIDLRGRGGFPQGRENPAHQLFLGLEHKDATGSFGRAW